MKRYRVLVHGVNVQICVNEEHDLVEKPQMVSLFATRYVNSENEKTAISKAIESVKDELKRDFQALFMPNTEFLADTARQAKFWEGRTYVNRGFTFYYSETENDDISLP